MTEFVTPHLRTVLKTYQDTATKSLHGPALLHHNLHYQQQQQQQLHLKYPHDHPEDATGTSDEMMDEDSHHHHHPHHHHHSNRSSLNNNNNNHSSHSRRNKNTSSAILSSCTTSPSSDDVKGGSGSGDLLVVQIPPPPELNQPILTEPDTAANGCGTLFETVLEGRRIGCFMLGGELRLCLPQVLNNVLMDFSLDQINCTCERLQIFCSQCTLDQLHEFKAAKILPDDVKTSGLITRTNAERLCAALLCRGDKQPPLGLKPAAVSFRVSHRCFGGADGVCRPELFSLKQPVCIECEECGDWFSPQTFVFHGHGPQEEQTCHWGFDSGNWRAYIHVADEEDGDCCASEVGERAMVVSGGGGGGSVQESEKVREKGRVDGQGKREKCTALLDEMKEREYQETILWIQEQQRDGGLKRKVSDEFNRRIR